MFVRRRQRACQWRSSLHERLSPTTRLLRNGGSATGSAKPKQRTTQLAKESPANTTQIQCKYNTNTNTYKQQIKRLLRMIESLNFGLVLSKIKENRLLTTSHNVSRAQNGIVTSLRMHHPGNSIQIPNPKIPSKSQNPLQTSSQAPKMGLSHRKFHPNPKSQNSFQI